MKKIKQFLFHNTNTKQTVAKNTFWLFLGEVFSRLLKMVLIIYIARTLGATGWGTFSYALSTASLVMIFSDIGLGSLITREIIQKKEGYEKFISTAILLKNILLAFSILFLLLVNQYLSTIPEATKLFPVITLIFLFDTIRELAFSINRAFEKMEREMIVKTIMGGTIAVLGIIILQINPKPISIAVAYTAGSFVGCIAILIMFRKDVSEFFIVFDKRLIKSVLKTTWPFAIITLIGNIMGNTDIYMLGIWRNAEEIGLYSSAQRIHQFILIIPAMIATSSFPMMSRLADSDKIKFKIALEKTLLSILIIGIPVSIGGIILGHNIIPLLLGTQYLGSIPIFQILMVMLLASFPLILLSNAIFAVNKQKNIAIAYICAILVNIILNYLLIPSFGAIGSALATCISTFVITLILWIKMWKIQHFSVITKLKKCIFATVLMTLSIFTLDHFSVNIFINILFGCIIYFSTLLILKDEIILEFKKFLKF